MNIPRDKLMHLAAGAALALAGLLIHDWRLGAALCVLFGLAREGYGAIRGRFSWSDLLATLVGGAAVLAVARIFF